MLELQRVVVSRWSLRFVQGRLRTAVSQTEEIF
jgi:hypothetical protein